MNFIYRAQTVPRTCYLDQKNLIKSHHFCLKVLTAMYELQSGNSLYNEGIKSKDIIRYMLEKFELDGDVKTQVHISLQQSLAYGFITKEAGKYKLVGPMAKVIQEPQDSEERFNEIDRVIKIFWNTRKFTSANMQQKLIGKESPIAVLPEDEEEISCSENCYPVRKSSRKRHRRSRGRTRSRSGTSKTSACTSRTDTNTSKTSSGGTSKQGNKTGKKRRYRSSSPSGRRRGRSYSRKRRGRGGGKRRKKVINSSSALLLQSGDPDCIDLDCTCN